jgi:hypothetical protein
MHPLLCSTVAPENGQYGHSRTSERALQLESGLSALRPVRFGLVYTVALGAVRLVHAGRWWLALLIIPCLTALLPILRCAAGRAVDTGAMLRLVIPGLGLFAG